MKKKTHIVFCNLIKFWGGGEKWHLEHAIHYDKLRDYKVTILCLEHSELYKKSKSLGLNVSAITLNSWLKYAPWPNSRLTKHLKDLNIDLIILNGSKELNYIALSAKKAGIKSIIYRRGIGLPPKLSRKNIKLIAHTIDHILCPSETIKELMLPFVKYNGELEIKVIPNSLDIEKFKPISYEQKSIVKIGSVGRLVSSKKHIELIRLAQSLKSQKQDFSILIAGEGKIKQDLINKSKKLSADDKVKFLGFEENIPQFLESLDIYIHPSDFEGFGYAILEAMAVGLPIICKDKGSMNELVTHGINGFLYTTEEELLMLTKKLLTDTTLRAQLGKKSREIAKNQYDRSIILEEFEDFISSLHSKN